MKYFKKQADMFVDSAGKLIDKGMSSGGKEMEDLLLKSLSKSHNVGMAKGVVAGVAGAQLLNKEKGKKK